MTRLSYVVATDSWEPVARLAESLGRQTAAQDVELVLVTDQPFELPAIATSVRQVVAAGGRGARVAGVRAAVGDVVALGETHVVPSPGWAQAVLDAHDAGAAVVLPRMQNANPDSALSWGAFLMDYGRYAGVASSSTPVPTYNATIRRAVLLELPELEQALQPGLTLEEVLRARRVSVAQPPEEATLAHVNVDRPLDWARERMLGGLLLARTRRTSFGRGRRVGYALAWPLIALVVLRRALRAPRGGAPRGTVHALALGCVLSAVGEAAGYVGPSGSGRAERHMLEFETHKRAHTRRAA